MAGFLTVKAGDLYLDLGSGHTVMYHSSTFTYTPNFIEIEQMFCGRTDGRTGGRQLLVVIKHNVVNVVAFRVIYSTVFR